MSTRQRIGGRGSFGPYASLIAILVLAALLVYVFFVVVPDHQREREAEIHAKTLQGKCLTQDLRSPELNYYLVMVATSYDASDDPQTAEERLASWPRAELTKALADLTQSLRNTDPVSAAAVQQLGSDLKLNLEQPTKIP